VKRETQNKVPEGGEAGADLYNNTGGEKRTKREKKKRYGDLIWNDEMTLASIHAL
jgi:hypothetical protein